MQKTLTFRVLQDPEVDRESGITAATVVAAGAAGHLGNPFYWYEGLVGWVLLSDPSKLARPPLGTEFYLAWTWTNDSAGYMVGHVEITVTKPDGSEVTPAADENQDYNAPPGGGRTVGFDGVVLDQAGTYRATATLSSGGETLDTMTLDVAIVGTAEEAGEIYLYRFYNPNTGEFQDTPPTVAVGQEAGVVAYFNNTGGQTQNMSLDMVVKAPDGSETTLTGGILVTVPGDTLWQVQTWICDQVGTYKVMLILYAELA